MNINLRIPKSVLYAVGGLLAVGLIVGATLLVSGGGGDDEHVRVATVTTTSPASGTTGAEGVEVVEEPDPADEVEADDSCEALGITKEELKEGSCFEGKTEYVVANKDGTIKLDQLTARLLGISTAETLQGRSFGPKNAKGIFVSVELEITNETNVPQIFDSSGDLVQLLLGPDTYTEDFNVENGTATDSFVWRSKEIQPNESTTGTAVFDIPEEALPHLEKNGNVQFGNFRDDMGFGRWKQRGVFRTYN